MADCLSCTCWAKFQKNRKIVATISIDPWIWIHFLSFSVGSQRPTDLDSHNRSTGTVLSNTFVFWLCFVIVISLSHWEDISEMTIFLHLAVYRKWQFLLCSDRKQFSRALLIHNNEWVTDGILFGMVSIYLLFFFDKFVSDYFSSWTIRKKIVISSSLF